MAGGGRRMTRGERGRVSLRRSVQAVSGFINTSTTSRWFMSRYPQPSLICSTLREDQFCGPCSVTTACARLVALLLALAGHHHLPEPERYRPTWTAQLGETPDLRHATSLGRDAPGRSSPILGRRPAGAASAHLLFPPSATVLCSARRGCSQPSEQQDLRSLFHVPPRAAWMCSHG